MARSAWGKVAMVAALAAIPWSLLRESPAQQPQKRSYDLGARNSVALLQLDPQVWTDVNRFVFLIGVDASEQPGTNNLAYVNSLRKLDTYPKLHEACRRWASAGFENLQRLANELSNGEIRKLLGDLKAAVDLRRRDPVAAQRDFREASEKLLPLLTRCEAISKGVKEDLDSLSTWTIGAAAQSRADRSPEERRVVEVAPRLSDVVARLAGLKDRWSALGSDLASLRKEMDTNLNSTDAFDLEITLDVGSSSWEAVELAAKSFVTDVPKQRKYLTGENYYDDCPLKENVWYSIESKLDYLRQRLPGLPRLNAIAPYYVNQLNTQRRIDMGLKPNQPDPAGPAGAPIQCVVLGGRYILTAPRTVQWRFEKLGRGWWRIVSRERGDGESLDVMSDSSKPARYYPNMVASRPGAFSGQWWRCVPTEERGCIRFYNSFLGESQSMTLTRVEVPPKGLDPGICHMTPTKNAVEQYWVVFPFGGD